MIIVFEEFFRLNVNPVPTESVPSNVLLQFSSNILSIEITLFSQQPPTLSERANSPFDVFRFPVNENPVTTLDVLTKYALKL